MVEKFKNTSIVTKILYILALILFFAWVIPSMVSYYSNVNKYEKSVNEIEKISSKYALTSEAKPFTVEAFKESAKVLFSKVDINPLSTNRYEVSIKMKREDIKSFHTFVETLSLRYLVQIDGALEFKANDEDIEAKMTLVKL